MGKRLRSVLACLCLAIAYASLFTPTSPPADGKTPAQETSRALLPLIFDSYPRRAPVFGVEINPGRVAATVVRASEAKVEWVRYRGIAWSEVEATPGILDWSKISAAEAEIRAIGEQGLAPIVIIYSTPGWAQKVPDWSCGPITEEALDDFASFIHAAVERYSQPPYNVRYWELWNEPDVAPRLVSTNSVYGCWGTEAVDEACPEPSPDYYGGCYYAEMLKQAYPAMKTAHPAAQVVLGGLLLDCDPRNPPPGENCLPANFLEGVLVNGGAPFFDVLAYHAYPHWSSWNSDWDLDHYYWMESGGILLGKLSFLREVMADYSVDKPVLMTEGGLLCHEKNVNCPGDDFFNDQANYAIRLYARSWANGLLGSIWYTLDGPGWRQGGLLDENQEPRPAYTSLQFLASLLEGADFAGQLSADAPEGYRFLTVGKEYQVYWMNDETSTSLLLPPGTLAVYDKFGQEITPGDPSLVLGFEPVVIEIER